MGAFIINIDEYDDVRTNWMPIYVRDDNVTYFDSFRVENIPKENKKFISNKTLKRDIWLQAFDSIMPKCFCIEFICQRSWKEQPHVSIEKLSKLCGKFVVDDFINF